MQQNIKRALSNFIAFGVISGAALVLVSTPQVARAHGGEEHNPEDTPVTGPYQQFLPSLYQGNADTPTVQPPPNLHEQNDYDLAEAARKRDEPPFVVDTAKLQAQAAQAAKNVDGEWSAPKAWPFVFATAANLPDGRIIAWGGNNPTSFGGGTNTYASVWDPATDQITANNNNAHSMFCAIPTMLEDGRVFVNGGDGTRERTSTFDFRTNTWARLEDMNAGRWYPGSVALPNGKVFTAIGNPGGNFPEVWSQGQGWSLLTGANLQNNILSQAGNPAIELPYLHLAPNGKLLHTGPTVQMNWIDPTGNGSVAAAGTGATWYPKYSTGILYDEGKILVAGGSVSTISNAATNKAMTIDINSSEPQKTVIASMTYTRTFQSSIILPNGEVLVVGGNSTGAGFSDDGTVLPSEIWNPTTRQWRTVASISVPRNYHSVGLLMMDGRVFSGGGGLCACSADHPDFQIYSPPYLFNANGTLATRPTITNGPSVVTYGSNHAFQATAGLQKFSMVKMSGTTHNLNSDLRFLNVPFTVNANGSYQLNFHSNPNVMTPGYWMLFALNAQGVPSVAKIIQVSNNSTGLTAISPTKQIATFQKAVSLPISTTTRSGQSINYSATGLPNGLTIDATTGLISGVPVPGAAQATSVISISDGVNTIQIKVDWTLIYGSLTFGKPVSASSSFAAPPQWDLQSVTDNALNTGWTSDGNLTTNHTEWVMVDMGAVTPLNQVALTARSDGTNVGEGFPIDFKIEVSNDNSAWTTVVNRTGYPKPGGAPQTFVFANTSGRYLRITGTNLRPISTENNVYRMQFAEIQAYNFTNLALNKLVSASSSYEAGGWSRSYATDGQTTSTAASMGWTSDNNLTANHTEWLAVDLGASALVDAFALTPRNDAGNIGAGFPADFKIEVSSNNIDWTPVVTQTNYPKPDGNAQMFSIASVAARYMRVTGTNLRPIANDANRYRMQLAEVQVNGKPNVGLSVQPITSSPPKPVNTAINYTANASGNNVRYKWLFGDGSTETAYTTTASIAKTFAQPGLYPIKLTVTDNSGAEKNTTFVQAVHLPPTTNRPTSSSNIAYETRTGSNARVWVVNQDNDTVSVFDAVTNAKVTEIGVGSKPRSIAIAPNGNVWVVNKGAASISIIAPNTLVVAQTIMLPFASQPFGMAFAPTGNTAFVVLEASGKLVKLDATNGTQTGSTDVGANVRGVAVSSDGATVWVSRFITPRLPGEETANVQSSATAGAEVISVNAASMTINKTVVLQHSDIPDTENQGRGIPNYLGAATLSPDGQSAWVPSKKDNVKRGTLRDGSDLTFQNTVRAITSRIDLTSNGGNEDLTSRVDHDNSSLGSAALFDKSGSYLFVALETSRDVAVIDAYARKELFRFAVGRAPQGLAISADGLRLYVNNFMDRSIGVYDLTSLINSNARSVPLLTTLNAVATEKLTAQVLNGKQLFYDAKDTRLARDSYMSCASCHNDGGQDGRVWDFTGFGEGLRNTIALNGRGGMAQGFLHWSGNFNEIQDFEGQIRNFAGGTGLMSDAAFNTGTRNTPLGDAKAGQSTDLDALAAYLTSLNTFAPSPYRNNDGTLTTDAQAGKTVFQSANCGQCHGGTAFSGSGANTLFNIGTLKANSGKRLNTTLAGIDPPTLRDVWTTGPYLHDGSAATLNAAISAHTTVTQNMALNATQIQQVVAYLQQIGNGEGSTPVTNVAQGKTATQSSVYEVGNPARAVDGRTDGVWINGSVTHTGFDANAWWQVDLGGSSTISNIVLWNRTDCCADRLKNFYVFVSSTDLTGRTYASIVADASVWKYQVTAQAPASLSIPVNTSGRYVRVQLVGNNALSLTEVQVFGSTP